MYSAGGDHPLRAPCREIVDGVAKGDLDGVISAEVIQEILHRYMARLEPERAREMASGALDVFAPILSVTETVMQRAVDLLERYGAVPARDIVHAATCLEQGIEAIISPDIHFDQIREVRRIAPDDAAAVGSLA